MEARPGNRRGPLRHGLFRRDGCALAARIRLPERVWRGRQVSRRTALWAGGDRRNGVGEEGDRLPRRHRQHRGAHPGLLPPDRRARARFGGPDRSARTAAGRRQALARRPPPARQGGRHLTLRPDQGRESGEPLRGARQPRNGSRLALAAPGAESGGIDAPATFRLATINCNDGRAALYLALDMELAMPSRTAAIWATATGATIVVAGAAAAYWARPSVIWPIPVPSPVTERAPAPAAPAAQTPAAGAPPAVASAAVKPAFDVVSVDPTGDAVVAGRAAPHVRVELKDGGKTVAEATSDATGQFVMIPAPLPPGAHSLSLATGAGATLETSNTVAVAVAAPKAVPPAPQPSASAPSPAPKTASLALPASQPASAARVAIQSIEATAGGRLVARGVAEPNALVRLYISGAFVGDAQTKADGRWSLTIEHGMMPGAYAVRADEINPDAKVVARAEAPFNYPRSTPAPTAAGSSVSASPPATASEASAADIVVGALQTLHVEPGHTLWGISQKLYGDGSRYQLIFAANSNQIKNPNLIYPGQMFVVPRPELKP